MAYIVADGVRETTRTVGTDPFALIGADVGFQRFADVIVDGRALQINDTCPYAARSTTGNGAWETGIGTYSAVNTLTRTTILSSSNSNNAVDFGVGLKTVFMGPISGVLPPFNPQNRTLDLSIDALRDVTISTIALADKQTLSYDLASKAWVNVNASLTTGTVTSVGLVALSTLGLTISGATSPITSKGEFTLGGTLAVVHGGTGRTTALPLSALGDVQFSTTPANGQILKYDAVTSKWRNVAESLTGTVTNVTISGGDTGIAVTSYTTTTAAKFTLGGKLAVAYGGTGITTPLVLESLANVTLTSLANNQVLKYNLTAAKWVNAADAGNAGTVTSVAFAVGTTGLAVTGGPITVSGTFELVGTLNVESGGTGLSVAGDKGQVLKVDETTGLLSYQTLANPKLAELPDVSITSPLVDGHILKYNSVSKLWDNVPDLNAGGTVTSVGIIAPTAMGLTVQGSPITSKGDFTLGGILAVLHGGTGLSFLGTKGQVLTVNDTKTALEYRTLLASKLDDLLDVDAPSPTDGQVLKYTLGAWVNADDAKNAGTVTSVGIVGGTTGLTATNSPITSSGDIMLGGKLAVIHGGTGLDTPLRLTSLADVTLTSLANNQVLKYDLASLKWVNATDVAGTGTVRSVAIDGGTTGLFASVNGAKGAAIIEAGKFVLGGTLAVGSGGTGLSIIGAAKHVLKVNDAGNALTFQPLVQPNLDDLLDVTISTLTLADKQVLKYDSASKLWVNAADAMNAGTVTSVGLVAPTSLGLTVTPLSPITSKGEFTLGGTLAVLHGGTGRTTAIPLNDLLDVELSPTTLTGGQVLKYVAGVAPALGHWTNLADTVGVGTVTKVTITAPGTGIDVASTTTTSDAKFVLSGKLNIASGGTGLGLPGIGSADRVLTINTAGDTLAYQTLPKPLLAELRDVVGGLSPAAGDYLRWTGAAWGSAATSGLVGSGGTVTSVTINPDTTGLTVTPATITSAGTMKLGGVLQIIHGGTGLGSLGDTGTLLTVNSDRSGYTFTTPTAGGASGVSLLNGLTGPFRIMPGNFIYVNTGPTPGAAGTDITITGVAGGASGVSSVNGLTGVVSITSPNNSITVSAAGQAITLTGAVGGAQAINSVTAAAYSIMPADAQGLVTLNYATAIDVFVPYDPTNTFPVGTGIDFIQIGAGQVTFIWDSRIMLSTATGYKTRTIFSGCTLIKLTTNTWVLVGDTVV